MDKKQQQGIAAIVTDTMKEVMMPALEHIQESINELREDVSQLKFDVSQLKAGMVRLENHLDFVERKLDNVTLIHGDKLSDHQKRLTNLEQKQSRAA